MTKMKWILPVIVVGVAVFLSIVVVEEVIRSSPSDPPEPQTNDTIIPDYITAVHENENACDALVVTAHELEATAERCMETLRECTSMLQENHLIPKRPVEEKRP